MKPKAYFYIRFSTPEQEKGDSSKPAPLFEQTKILLLLDSTC